MKPFDKPIYVTRPHLPPLADYARGLEEIWSNVSLTNRGPIHERFAGRLAQRFQTNNLSLFTNGTLALQVGFQGLGLEGEVITTPFTFAASANALMQTGLEPVFVDIEPVHFTLDHRRIEAAITPRTSAILAVHVFGYPCALTALASIAERHGLKLIYDAAHVFGVTVHGQSIARFGDLSMFSFHATKPFHSVEGGALTFGEPALKAVFDRLCNHGLGPDGDVADPGTNAKMTEMQAVMGELMLERIDSLIAKSGVLEAVYRQRLADVPGIAIPPALSDDIFSNHAFMPILIDPADFGASRDQLHKALATFNVLARRYFHPLVTDMSGYRHIKVDDPMVVAGRVADQVLALPIYADLAVDDVHRICDIIAGIQRGDTVPAD